MHCPRIHNSHPVRQDRARKDARFVKRPDRCLQIRPCPQGAERHRRVRDAHFHEKQQRQHQHCGFENKNSCIRVIFFFRKNHKFALPKKKIPPPPGIIIEKKGLISYPANFEFITVAWSLTRRLPSVWRMRCFCNSDSGKSPAAKKAPTRRSFSKKKKKKLAKTQGKKNYFVKHSQKLKKKKKTRSNPQKKKSIKFSRTITR